MARAVIAILYTALALQVFGASPLMARAADEQAAAPAALEALRMRAQERMRKDKAVFSDDQFREIENLYQTANRDLGAPDAKQRLLELIEKYPASNRAGCAVL